MRNKTFLKTVAWITLVAMVNACSVYRIKSVEKIDEIRKSLALTPENTVLYVHVNGETKELKNVERNGHEISGDLAIPEAKELSVYLDGISRGLGDNHSELAPPPIKSSKASVSSDATMKEIERIVNTNNQIKEKNQFHFHLEKATVSDGEHIKFQDSNVVKMEILEKQKKADGGDVARIILTVLYVLLLILALAIIIALVVACNCPRIYLNNGTHWVYNNSLFAGATNSSLERTDFKRLDDFTPNADNLSMEIRNEESEIQSLNDLSLWAVLHNENERVVSDKQGNFYSLKGTIAPQQVVDAKKNDQAALVSTADDKAYAFNLLSSQAYQNVYSTFQGIDNRKDLRLILRVKNSAFAGVVNESIKEALGSSYEPWAAKNGSKSKATLEQAFEEKGAALTVLVKDGKQWVKIDQIDMVGNVAYHELAIPLKKEYIQKGELQIQLAAGFNLWALDQIAVDQGIQTPLEAYPIKATTATLDGQERAEVILNKDAHYLTLKQGESLKVEFNGLPLKVGKKRSLFLQGQGYYLPSHWPTNKPNWAGILKLQQPYGISKYAFDLYLDQFQMK